MIYKSKASYNKSCPLLWVSNRKKKSSVKNRYEVPNEQTRKKVEPRVPYRPSA